MSTPRPLPELLAPAGSPTALDAAIEGGADAVYFGGAAFNARMLAQNFGGSAMADAVARCHVYGVRAYITLNTLVADREMDDCLRTAEQAWRAGADALIVADLGVAAMLRRQIPELPLHASTQASGHNSAAAGCWPRSALPAWSAPASCPATICAPLSPNRPSRLKCSSTARSASPTRGSASFHRWSAGGAATAAPAPNPAVFPTP